MPVDYETELGLVRLFSSDVDEENFLLTDEQLNALLASEGHPKLAAARALEIQAASEALVSKKISTQDLSTDGPAVAKELRELAKGLRDEAHLELDGDGFFDIVDMGRVTRPELTE